MTPSSAFGLSLAILILAISPGPGVFAVIARALASGCKACLPFVAGIVTGDIIYLLMAVFGLSAVAGMLGQFFIVIKLCGGAYLIVLGIRIWRQPVVVRPDIAIRRDKTCVGAFTGGVAITLSNPKVILFYGGFLPAFMDLATLSAMDITIVLIIVSLTLGGVLTAYAFLSSRSRRLISSPKALTRMNRTAGCAMMGAGVAIAMKS